MVEHDWVTRTYRWMERVVKVLSRLMERWKTRLEVSENGQVNISRWINVRRGFYQVITTHQSSSICPKYRLLCCWMVQIQKELSGRKKS